MQTDIVLPQGISASYENNVLSINGKNGNTQRPLSYKQLALSVTGNKISLKSHLQGRRQRKIIGTFKAHIRNMIRGCNEMHHYELKICSGHFPMSVTTSKEEFTVKNFLGEKIPRILRLKKGAAVKVEGDKVIVESISKELAGQTAADIEQLTRRTNYDTRIFQDGIYITNKDGKDIK